jgi:hypothetical protein
MFLRTPLGKELVDIREFLSTELLFPEAKRGSLLGSAQ